MRAALLTLLALLAAVALLVLFGRVRTTVCLAVERNGLWIRLQLLFGPVKLADLQLRWRPGEPARLWQRGLFVRRYRPAQVPGWAQFGPQMGRMPVPLDATLTLLRRLRVELMDLRLRLGVDDAAATALLCGLLDAIVFALRAALTGHQSTPEGNILILPDFSKKRFSVRFRCIVTLQIRHSIPVVLKSLTGRNNDERSSNRKYHADYHGEHTQHG